MGPLGEGVGQVLVEKDIGNFVGLLGNGEFRVVGFVGEAFTVGVDEDGPLFVEGVFGVLPGDEEAFDETAHDGFGEEVGGFGHEFGEQGMGGQEL